MLKTILTTVVYFLTGFIASTIIYRVGFKDGLKIGKIEKTFEIYQDLNESQSTTPGQVKNKDS